MKESLQLVSVCIITYNSSRTVLETLDSVFAQSFPRLELIISDDCSTDDTIRICKQWEETHKHRFESIKLIVRDENGGVATNLNTAIKASSGEWIKPCAGDDLLLPDCILNNMNFADKETSANVVFSISRDFYQNDNGRFITDDLLPDERSKRLFELTPQEQYDVLLSYNFVPATTLFLKRSFALNHLFSEQYPFCEDWPQWLRLTSYGEKLYFMDVETVLYRIGPSLSRAQNHVFVSPGFFDSYKAFYFAERYEALKKKNPKAAMVLRKEFFIGEMAVLVLKNHRTLLNKGILYVFKRILGIKKIHFFQ